jgi:hypothetical protein
MDYRSQTDTAFLSRAGAQRVAAETFVVVPITKQMPGVGFKLQQLGKPHGARHIIIRDIYAQSRLVI